MEDIRSEVVAGCPLCGVRERSIIYEGLKDFWYGAPGRWCFKRCNGCSLVYLDPRPAPASLARAYERYYTHSDSISTASKDSSLGGVRRSGKSVLKRLYRMAMSPLEKKRLKLYKMYLTDLPPGRLLDVGCGDGRFLAHMRSLGWVVSGVETDPMSAQLARDTFALPVHVGTLEDAEYEESSFDAVTMSHVIEHVYDPIRLLSEIRRVLRNDGVLMISTPNFDSLGRRLFKSHWRGLEPPRHLSLFTCSTLQRCASEAGFLDVLGRTTGLRADYPTFSLSLRAKMGMLRGDGTVQDYRSVPDRAPQRAIVLGLFLTELMINRLMPELGEELILRAKKE